MMTEQRLQEIEDSVGRIDCPDCAGSGVYLYGPTGNDSCEECDGHGMVSRFAPAHELIAEIRRLRAALTAAQAWQPINTAPRDGTAILLTDGTYIRTGWWASRRNAWSVDTIVQLAMPTQWAALPAIAQSAPAPKFRCTCWLGRPGWTCGSSEEREACAVHGIAQAAPAQEGEAEVARLTAERDASKSAEEVGYRGVRRLIDRKGGNPAEWPADLRVRQFPAVRA